MAIFEICHLCCSTDAAVPRLLPICLCLDISVEKVEGMPILTVSRGDAYPVLCHHSVIVDRGGNWL